MFNFTKKDTKKREEYIEQRKIYLNDIRNTSKTFDNIMITLSSGLMGAVLIFIPNIIKDFKDVIDSILLYYVGFFFICLFLSIVSILVSYKLSYNNSNLGIQREDKVYKSKIKDIDLKDELCLIEIKINKNNKNINFLNIFSLYAFIFGLLSVLLFYFLILFNYVK